MRWPRIVALACAVSLLGAVALPPRASAHLNSRLSLVEDVPSAAASRATLASPGLSWTAPATSAPVPWHPLLLLLGLGALALAWTLRRGRRVGPVVLALVLGLMGAEAAYHGVHHLGDRDAAEKCVVFAASAHVDGLVDDRPASPAPADALEAVPPGRAASEPTLSLTGLHEGRAPPASST